ncbi:MAG: VOC family protein [Sphingomonadaceae bacterium]
MAVELNHMIVESADKVRGAAYVADILGLPAPKPFARFMVVELDNGVSLDFMDKSGNVTPQHYAFLVEDSDFDAMFERIKASGAAWWADPGRTKPHEINHRYGGRGVYFDHPDGHLLEILTTPYGSAT